ncbi:hypothetical protein [Glutamicibacter arilaitensis]|uniref:hypothetical protein n=1 Tax=Glutamicibacter arilaitensis TaxID=256701 RepID=UPI00384BAE17
MSQRRLFRRIICPVATMVFGVLTVVSLVSLAFTNSTSADDDRLAPPAKCQPK